MYMEWADFRLPTVGDEAVVSFARNLIAYINDLSYTPLEPLDLKRLVVLKNKYREACAWLKRGRGSESCPLAEYNSETDSVAEGAHSASKLRFTGPHWEKTWKAALGPRSKENPQLFAVITTAHEKAMLDYVTTEEWKAIYHETCSTFVISAEWKSALEKIQGATRCSEEREKSLALGRSKMELAPRAIERISTTIHNNTINNLVKAGLPCSVLEVMKAAPKFEPTQLMKMLYWKGDLFRELEEMLADPSKGLIQIRVRQY